MGIHTFGAVMFVFGYNALEAYALKRLWAKLGDRERKVRSWCVIASVFCMVSFVLAGIVYSNLEKLGICCDDKYIDSVEGVMQRYHTIVPNASLERDMVRKTYGHKMLKDS